MNNGNFQATLAILALVLTIGFVLNALGQVNYNELTRMILDIQGVN
jgi:hypothetical protein